MFALVQILASASLVYSGTIGQTVDSSDGGKIPWTACAWCVADRAGDVHFPGGWKIRGSSRTPVREVNDVPGLVFSDGEGNLYYYLDRRAELGTVVVGSDGLHPGDVLARAYHWDLKFHAAPASCAVGFAAGGHRFFALDRRRREVHAWKDDGEDAGIVFSFSGRTEKFCSLAIHPASGDLLLGDPWPANRVHRFRPDGSEVRNAFWPYGGYALNLKNVGRETWILGATASRIVESNAPDSRDSFGVCAKTVNDIAAGCDGFYLATTQGGQFYPAADPKRCAMRIGGIGNVTAMGICDGRVLVCDGYRMLNFWLDDGPDDPIVTCDFDCIARDWNEVVDRIEVRDGIFHLNEKIHGRVIAFDPRVTEWTLRDKRLYDVTNVSVNADNRRVRVGRRCAVWARDDGLQLYEHDGEHHNRLVQTLPYRATHLAASGEWLLAYVPERKAILRFRQKD